MEDTTQIHEGTMIVTRDRLQPDIFICRGIAGELDVLHLPNEELHHAAAKFVEMFLLPMARRGADLEIFDISYQAKSSPWGSGHVLVHFKQVVRT